MLPQEKLDLHRIIRLKAKGRKVALLFEGVDFATLFCGLNLYTKGYIITRKVGTALCGFIFIYNVNNSTISGIKKSRCKETKLLLTTA